MLPPHIRTSTILATIAQDKSPTQQLQRQTHSYLHLSAEHNVVTHVAPNHPPTASPFSSVCGHLADDPRAVEAAYAGAPEQDALEAAASLFVMRAGAPLQRMPSDQLSSSSDWPLPPITVDDANAMVIRMVRALPERRGVRLAAAERFKRRP